MGVAQELLYAKGVAGKRGKKKKKGRKEDKRKKKEGGKKERREQGQREGGRNTLQMFVLIDQMLF